jgi:GNAT superfamily N-acetyltransferase
MSPTQALASAVVAVAVLVSIWWIVNRRAIEPFEPYGDCKYHADQGFACAEAATVKGTDGRTVTITTFQSTSPGARAATVGALRAEWGEEFTEESVAATYPGGDVMFVMLNDDGAFVACVSVDRALFVPTISNLLVTTDQRGRGYGSLMLTHAEEYVTGSLKFPSMTLWCEPHMRAFYEVRGWSDDGFVEASDGQPPFYVMAKTT